MLRYRAKENLIFNIKPSAPSFGFFTLFERASSNDDIAFGGASSDIIAPEVNYTIEIKRVYGRWK
jgi:hypothetical protein